MSKKTKAELIEEIYALAETGLQIDEVLGAHLFFVAQFARAGRELLMSDAMLPAVKMERVLSRNTYQQSQ